MSDIRKWDEVNGVDEAPRPPSGVSERAPPTPTPSYSRGGQTTPSISGSGVPMPASSDRARDGHRPLRGGLPRGAAQVPDTPEAVMAQLEAFYVQFNTARPEDFRGHSLSVSDIVALKVGRRGIPATMWIPSALRSWENFALRETLPEER